MSGPARARRAGAAGGHADVARDVRRCAARRPRCPRTPARTRSRRSARCSRGARAPLVLVGGSRWDAAACAALRTFAEAHRAARRRGLPLPGPVRQPASAVRRRRRHRHQSEARGARARRPTCCSSIGERLGEMTTGGYTLIDAAGAAAAADPRASGRRTNSAASTSPRWRSPRRPAPSWPRSMRAPAAARGPAGARMRAAAHADYEAWRAPRPGPRRRRPVAESCAGSTSACPTTRSSPTAPATTRPGCTASSATAASARSSRPTPARWATACRRPSAPRPSIRTAWWSRGTATAAS